MPILELPLWKEQIWLAIAVTEATVVEHERRDSRSREPLGKRTQPVAACP